MYMITVNHQDSAGERILWSDYVAPVGQIISPSQHEAIDETSTFDFTILPNHDEYNRIKKFKSTVTVTRNDRIIFHGRVMADGKDMYGQKSIACESALSFLLDSVQSPVSKRNETPLASFTRIIQNHNSQMAGESYKHFTIGTVNIDDANTSKSYELTNYSDTRGAIDELVKEYKGFLRARYVNGVNYIDWLKDYGRTNAQPIKMAVNLLDISSEETVDEYYTVMFPVGNRNRTIETVNDGDKYLRNAAAIAEYGTIIHPESFDANTPADIKEKAQKEFAKHSGELPKSFTVKAVDMSLLGQSVDELLIGDKLTNVEGYDGTLTIAEIDRDLLNPDNDSYTLENQAAIDKRKNSSGGKGTISSRSGGYGASLGDLSKEQYHLKNLTLNIDDTLAFHATTLTAHAKLIDLSADQIQALAGGYDWISQKYGDMQTEQAKAIRAFYQSYRHQTPTEIVDTVRAVVGFGIEETTDGSTPASPKFTPTKVQKRDKDGELLYKLKLKEDGTPEYNPDGSVVYERDEDGNRIPIYEYAGIDGQPVMSIQATQKQTAKRVETTVGTIGIQLDPRTDEPFRDADGNYIYVETDKYGYPILKNGEYQVIDFPPGTVTSKIKQTQDRVTIEVRNRENADRQLSGRVDVTDSRVAMVVGTVDDGGNYIKSAEIATAINNDDSTDAIIHADHVQISGNTTLNGQFSVRSGMLYVDTALGVGNINSDIVSINNGKVTASTFDVKIGGKVNFVVNQGTQYAITSAVAASMVTGFGQGTTDATGRVSIPFYTVASPSTAPSASNVINFNIAGTAFYRDHVGIASSGSWYYDDETLLSYNRRIEANDGTYVDVGLPTISATTSFGTGASALVSVVGPNDSWGMPHQVGVGKRLYLQADNDYAYITTDLNTPTVNQNIVARITNSGGGTGVISAAGWEWNPTLGVYGNDVSGDGNTITIEPPTVTMAVGSFDSSHKATVSALGPAYSGNSHPITANATAVVDASGVYSDGITTGRGQMGISVTWSDNVATVAAAQSIVKNDTITVTSNSVITYDSTTHKYSVVSTALADGDVVYTAAGKLTSDQAYQDGVTTGRGQMGVSLSVEDNVISASSVQSATKSDSVTITAIPSIVYNNTTHQYTITASAKADNDVIYTSGGQGSGTQAYTDGVTIGRGQMGVSLTLDDNVVQASVVQSNTKSDSLTITAVPSIVYNSTTHQYTITASAKADNDVIYTSGGQGSGTQAYADGQNSINVSKGSWSSGGITFSPSAGTGSSASVQLSKGTETWNGNVCTFPILDSSSNTGLTCSVTAPSQVFSVSGNWSGGSYIVKDNHNTERLRTTLSSIVTNGTPTKSEISDTILSVPLKVLYDDGEDGGETGFSTSVSVNAMPIWNAAAATASVPGNTSTDKSTFTFTGPLTNGSTYSYDYTLSVDSTYCYVKATASGNLKLRIPNSFSPVKLEGYTASDATGYFSSEGVYIKHPGTHYYIRSHGTGSDGSGAQVYLVVCLRAQNSAGSYFYHSNLDSMGSGVPIGQSSSVAIMKNQVLKGPVTSIYTEGYKEGYKNANAITYTGAWNGSGTYTVTAKRDGTTIATRSTSPTLRLNGNGSANFSAELYSDTSSPVKQKSIPCYLIQDGNTVKACGKSDGTEVVGSITVSGSGGKYTPSDIRIGNISNVSGSHSTGDGTVLNDLSSAISRAGSRTYVRFVADLNGYSGSGKVYYISIN